ncbi:MAG: aminoacyl-tRNA deacylase [Thermodesulfobacteriota bacterium]
MPVEKLKNFLDENNIKYISVKHSEAFTAQEIAASAHIPGKELAKTVILDIDGNMAMAVVPASYHVNFKLFENEVKATRISLSTEESFKKKFPDCELGAMPPFGNLYKMDVYVSKSLAEDEEIFFNAGNHTELIRLKYKDFENLVHPKVLQFSEHN